MPCTNFDYKNMCLDAFTEEAKQCHGDYFEDDDWMDIEDFEEPI